MHRLDNISCQSSSTLYCSPFRSHVCFVLKNLLVHGTRYHIACLFHVTSTCFRALHCKHSSISLRKWHVVRRWRLVPMWQTSSGLGFPSVGEARVTPRFSPTACLNLVFFSEALGFWTPRIAASQPQAIIPGNTSNSGCDSALCPHLKTPASW